jgi:hypothetical protein
MLTQQSSASSAAHLPQELLAMQLHMQRLFLRHAIQGKHQPGTKATHSSTSLCSFNLAGNTVSAGAGVDSASVQLCEGD